MRRLKQIQKNLPSSVYLNAHIWSVYSPTLIKWNAFKDQFNCSLSNCRSSIIRLLQFLLTAFDYFFEFFLLSVISCHFKLALEKRFFGTNFNMSYNITISQKSIFVIFYFIISVKQKTQSKLLKSCVICMMTSLKRKIVSKLVYQISFCRFFT